MSDEQRGLPDDRSFNYPGTDDEDAALQEVADLLWESNQGAPPLHEDPLAARLGLIPDPSYALSPRALKGQRRKAGLQLSDLAVRLTARGWSVDRSDLYRWENGSTSDVSPALIKALARVLSTEADELVTEQPHEVPAEVARALASSAFEALVKRWAMVRHSSESFARSELTSRMLVTVHRGEHPDTEQMLQSLQLLVNATESAKASPRES